VPCCQSTQDTHKICSMNQRGFSNLSFMVHKIVWASHHVSHPELKFLHIEDGRLLQPSEKSYLSQSKTFKNYKMVYNDLVQPTFNSTQRIKLQGPRKHPSKVRLNTHILCNYQSINQYQLFATEEVTLKQHFALDSEAFEKSCALWQYPFNIMFAMALPSE